MRFASCAQSYSYEILQLSFEAVPTDGGGQAMSANAVLKLPKPAGMTQILLNATVKQRICPIT